MERPGKEGLHLHAILGNSFTPLAIALIHQRVQHATLYTDDEEKAQCFIRGFFKHLSKHNQGPENHVNLNLKLIPKNIRSCFKSLIESMAEFAESLLEKREPEESGKRVLFFSGTPAHLLMLSEVVGFDCFMTLKYDKQSQQSRLYLVDESGSEGLEEIVDLSLEEILSLYGLTLEELYERAPKINRKPIVKSIELRGTEIHISYRSDMNFTKGGARRKFCKFVLECESTFGKYGIKHLTGDIMLNNWLRNTALPISLMEVDA